MESTYENLRHYERDIELQMLAVGFSKQCRDKNFVGSFVALKRESSEIRLVDSSLIR